MFQFWAHDSSVESSSDLLANIWSAWQKLPIHWEECIVMYWLVGSNMRFWPKHKEGVKHSHGPVLSRVMMKIVFNPDSMPSESDTSYEVNRYLGGLRRNASLCIPHLATSWDVFFFFLERWSEASSVTFIVKVWCTRLFFPYSPKANLYFYIHCNRWRTPLPPRFSPN